MIIGIGSDLANIERIEKTIDKFGDKFISRVFSEYEIWESSRRKKLSKREYASSLAKKFAAKEACSKALGTGLRQGVFWKDMEIKHEITGKPNMVLSGGALKRLNNMLPEGYNPNIVITMTDDYPWAQAFVIIEAIKD